MAKATKNNKISDKKQFSKSKPNDKKVKTFFKYNWKHFVLWTLFLIAIIVALNYGVEKKVVVLVTIVLGLFTQFFAGITALIAMVPFIGPLIVKVLAIPFFWLLNGLGYFVSIVAIKKGFSRELVGSRVLTLAVLVGLVLGYIIGHIVPMR
ncbi:MAG: hypothetical protein V3R52_07870 [Candidatus Neomarinimicrobiota bacterium]